MLNNLQSFNKLCFCQTFKGCKDENDINNTDSTSNSWVRGR